MPPKSSVFFMEAPPKSGAGASVQIATRTGTAKKLQDVLNDPAARVFRGAPPPKPAKGGTFAVLFIPPKPRGGR